MNKLLVITLLISLLSFGTQGYRMPRQAEGEEAVAEEHAPEEPAAEEVAPDAPEEAVPEAPEAHAPEEVAPEEPAAESLPEHHGPDATEDSEEPESAGPVTYVTNTIRNAWDKTVDTTTGWIENIKGLNLEQKAMALYEETTSAVKTYADIVQDQVYHLIYQQ